MAIHCLVIHKVLGNSEGQVSVDIDFYVFAQCSGSSSCLYEFAFNKTELNALKAFVVKGIEVESESSSNHNLHPKFPIKLIHIVSQDFSNEQILCIVFMRRA